MKTICKITQIEEEQPATFSNGRVRRKQHVWVQCVEQKEAKQWQSLVTLWDERIDEFIMQGCRVGDMIGVDVIPSYRRIMKWNPATGQKEETGECCASLHLHFDYELQAGEEA